MPVREAAPADTPRWDSRVSKLLSQAAVSVVSWKDEEHPAVSERERALAGEAGAVADRANPFFESTARPERERETRTEAPDTGTLVVEDPASWNCEVLDFPGAWWWYSIEIVASSTTHQDRYAHIHTYTHTHTS